MGLFDKKKKEKIPELGQPIYGGGSGGSSGGRGPAATSSSSSSPSLGRNNSYASNAPSTVSSVPPSYRTAPGYVPPSQGGGGYQNQSHFARPAPPPANYPHQQQHPGYGQPDDDGAPAKGKGSWFGRGKKVDEDARNELLAGAPPPGQGPSRFLPGPGPNAGQQGGGYDPYSQRGGPSGHPGDEGGHQAQEFETEEDQEVEGIKQQMRFTKQESLASTRNAVRIAREAEETARATLDKLGEQSGALPGRVCPPRDLTG